jgi:hypothetical protein
MKYKIIRIEKPGMINNWNELELPDGAIPLHTEIWKYSVYGGDIIHSLEVIFDPNSNYKYNKETGELVKSREDGSGLEEFKIVTKIFCLIHEEDSEEANREE